MYFINYANDSDIVFKSDDGSGGTETYFFLDGNAGGANPTTIFPDESRLAIGSGQDLKLYHSPSTSNIDISNGDLKFRQLTDDSDIIFQCDDGSGGLATYLTIDGGAEVNLFLKNGRFNDNVKALFGGAGDLEIYHDGTDSIINNATGNLLIRNNDNDKDIKFQCDDGDSNLTTYFLLDGSSALHNGSATTALYTNWPDKSRISCGTSHDLQISHDGANSYIENSTNDLIFINYQDDGDIVFKTDDGSGGTTTYLTLDGGVGYTTAHKDIRFLDNVMVELGTDRELTIYSDGSNGIIANQIGNLVITNAHNDGDLILQCDDGSGGVTPYITLDGGNTGITVSAPQGMVFTDGLKAKFGNNDDLQIYHDGSNSRIDNTTGNLIIKNKENDQDIIFESDNGAGGTATYFFLDGSLATHDGSATTNLFTNWPDNSQVTLGSSRDLQLYHDGTDSYIDNNTGDLYIRNFADDKDIKFVSDNGAGSIATYFFLDGSAGGGDPATVFPDNSYVHFGSGFDLNIGHTGSAASITNNTGNLTFTQNTDDGDIIFKCDNGSGGVNEYMRIDGGDARVIFSKDVKLQDNNILRFGSGNDLQIVHNGTDSTITNIAGNLNIYQNTDDGHIRFYNDNGSGGTTEYVRLDGSDVSTAIKTIKVLMPNLPTSDPSVAGQLYIDASADRVLKVSAG